jgi:predicted RNase H-like HicB family nuclease
MKQLTYTVIIENAGPNFGAYVLDLPGCVAVGETEEEVLRLIREAIEFHIEGLIEDGEPVPPPTSVGMQVEVRVAA